MDGKDELHEEHNSIKMFRRDSISKFCRVSDSGHRLWDVKACPLGRVEEGVEVIHWWEALSNDLANGALGRGFAYTVLIYEREGELMGGNGSAGVGTGGEDRRWATPLYGLRTLTKLRAASSYEIPFWDISSLIDFCLSSSGQILLEAKCCPEQCKQDAFDSSTSQFSPG